MLYILLALIFGQELDFASQCEKGLCVVDNVPFGIGRDAVDWQISNKAPGAVKTATNAGGTLHYAGYRFEGMVETKDVLFNFNGKGQLNDISVVLAPGEGEYEYPEVVNLYFTIRDQMVSSGIYDSVEFMYDFKAPFSGTSEKDAMEGSYSGIEANALRQDRNGRMSPHRFGKIWSIFQNTKRPSVKAILMVSYLEGSDESDNNLYVTIEYKDTEFAKGGYVRGTDNTNTLKAKR